MMMEKTEAVKNPVLLIDACVRKESRTRFLAEKLLLKLGRPFDTLRLSDLAFPAVDQEYLSLRDRLLAEGNDRHPLFDAARQFAGAETIVIAAPYWDLSFPAMLRQYLELVNVPGITFRYSEKGVPVGLCRARRLFYVTTAGGCFVPDEFGFGYIRSLAQNFYGIPDVWQVRALGLDLEGADVPAILRDAEDALSAMDLD